MNLKNISFGIVQGRLTKSKEIQKFPKTFLMNFQLQKNWL